jgi:hypothetical protein
MTAVEDELAQKRREAAGPAEEERDDEVEARGDESEPEAPEPATEPEKPPKLLQESLPGDWDTIPSEFGGAAPDRSEIRLLGGKMPIEGAFDKGTEIDLLVRVRVTGVLGQDLEDAYGTRGGTVRRHMARMVSVRRVNR